MESCGPDTVASTLSLEAPRMLISDAATMTQDTKRDEKVFMIADVARGFCGAPERCAWSC